MVAIVAMYASGAPLHAQSAASGQSGSAAENPQAMQERISRLEAEVAELKAMVKQHRGGLFSGLNQELKENTVTFDYSMAYGFLMRFKWRRDDSNQPSFLSDV
jgi:hypothetical protein